MHSLKLHKVFLPNLRLKFLEKPGKVSESKAAILIIVGKDNTGRNAAISRLSFSQLWTDPFTILGPRNPGISELCVALNSQSTNFKALKLLKVCREERSAKNSWRPVAGILPLPIKFKVSAPRQNISQFESLIIRSSSFEIFIKCVYLRILRLYDYKIFGQVTERGGGKSQPWLSIGRSVLNSTCGERGLCVQRQRSDQWLNFDMWKTLSLSLGTDRRKDRQHKYRQTGQTRRFLFGWN